MRSAELWAALADELGRDFEYDRKGSVVIAETESELAEARDRALLASSLQPSAGELVMILTSCSACSQSSSSETAERRLVRMAVVAWRRLARSCRFAASAVNSSSGSVAHRKYDNREASSNGWSGWLG